MMPSQQRHNLSPNECRPAEDFDFSDVVRIYSTCTVDSMPFIVKSFTI